MSKVFARWVYGLRVHLGSEGKPLPQAKLAERLGCNQPDISRYENKYHDPEQENLAAFVTLALEVGYPVDPLQLSLGDLLISPDRQKVSIVGEIGTGAIIHVFEDSARSGGMEKTNAPIGIDGDLEAVRVRGDSMYPMQEGWLLFYRRVSGGVSDECLEKLCVVKRLEDDVIMVKNVHQSGRRGFYNLTSWNAPPISDVRLAWASRVVSIRPT